MPTFDMPRLAAFSIRGNILSGSMPWAAMNSGGMYGDVKIAFLIKTIYAFSTELFCFFLSYLPTIEMADYFISFLRD
jgi:hypothetical protein